MPESTENFTVPSGEVFVIQSASIVDLWIDGTLPDPLSATVANLILARDMALDEATDAEREQVGDFTPDRERLAIRQIVRAITVDPVVTADQEDARQLRAAGRNVKLWQFLNTHDRYALYHKAMGDAARLQQTFRAYERWSDAMAAVHHSNDNASIGIRPARDSEESAVAASDGG